MPTYEYRCGACEHELEVFQSITAKPKRKCPACGKSKLERLISGGGAILFKGGGFYETDYRSESYKKAAEADKKSTTGDADKGSSTSESKTETKAAAKKDAPSGKPAAKPDKPAKPAAKK